MRLLVLSDIHGQETALHQILRCEAVAPKKIDLVVFLGDGLREFDWLSYRGEFAFLPMLSVRGNCDFFRSDDVPELRKLSFYGHRILMTHGHRFDVKSGLSRATAFAASKEIDLLLFGHTHVPKEIRLEKGDTFEGAPVSRPLILFNPGAVESGSYGLVTLSEDKIVCEHRQK